MSILNIILKFIAAMLIMQLIETTNNRYVDNGNKRNIPIICWVLLMVNLSIRINY